MYFRTHQTLRILFALILNFTLINSFENRPDFVNDDVVYIDAVLQQERINEVGIACNESYRPVENSTLMCPQRFDSIMCWPETPVNTTIFMDCPNYINKFIKTNKANKTCYFNGTMAVWARTGMFRCVPEDDPIDWEYIAQHYRNMLIMRITGYVTSMISLLVSIVIMVSIKRLRCPRNYVHINLFVAFALRTVLTMISGELIDSTKFKPETRLKIQVIDPVKTIVCRISVFLFRYTGAVYHVAIFSEALYLVLLLKFPFYSEKRGYKFCIFISWILPLFWTIPWLITRMTVHLEADNVWCWQAESPLNFILKIPQSILLISNLCCAIFIIKVLYSKLETKISREKVLKYRRLAKSILILIPIFGLHFVLFAWSPYAKMNLGLTITFNYIESFFSSFQGFVVSITCCFIQRDVRIETIIFLCKCFKSAKCYAKFPCCVCFNPDYITIVRQKFSDQSRHRPSTISRSSLYDKARTQINTSANGRQSISTFDDEQQSFTSCSRMNSTDLDNYLTTQVAKHTKKDSTASTSVSTRSDASFQKLKNSFLFRKLFNQCLFDSNARNDFYQSTYHGHGSGGSKKKSIFLNTKYTPMKTVDTKKPSVTEHKLDFDVNTNETTAKKNSQTTLLLNNITENEIEPHIAKIVKFSKETSNQSGVHLQYYV